MTTHCKDGWAEDYDDWGRVLHERKGISQPDGKQCQGCGMWWDPPRGPGLPCRNCGWEEPVVCTYCGEGVADGWRLNQMYEYQPGQWVCVCCVRKYE